jgi:hypothetical protein
MGHYGQCVGCEHQQFDEYGEYCNCREGEEPMQCPLKENDRYDVEMDLPSPNNISDN